MAMLWFYCDESADQPSHAPKNFAVTGLLGEEKTFAKLERLWQKANDKFGVNRYHAAPMNARVGEFLGWSPERSIEYSKALLSVLKKRGPLLQVTSIGMHADSYRDVLSEHAQAQWGSPQVACFKACVTMIASGMGKLAKEWQFSVIFERNGKLVDADIVKAFYLLKDQDPDLGARMGTCTPGQWDQNIALQPADLVAYESMRLIKDKRNDDKKMRHAFKAMMGVNSFHGFYFDREMIASMKDQLENSHCSPGGWFPVSRQWDASYKDGDSWDDLEAKKGVQ